MIFSRKPLSERYNWNHIIEWFENPRDAIFLSRMTWFIVSKAFFKSMWIIPASRPESKPVSILSVRHEREVLLNISCKYRTLLSVRYFVVCSCNGLVELLTSQEQLHSWFFVWGEYSEVKLKKVKKKTIPLLLFCSLLFLHKVRVFKKTDRILIVIYQMDDKEGKNVRKELAKILLLFLDLVKNYLYLWIFFIGWKFELWNLSRVYSWTAPIFDMC